MLYITRKKIIQSRKKWASLSKTRKKKIVAKGTILGISFLLNVPNKNKNKNKNKKEIELKIKNLEKNI